MRQSGSYTRFALPRRCAIHLAAILLLLGVNFNAQAGETPAPVAFEWFEYSGIDPDVKAPLEPGTLRNPILTGFYPDPSIHQIGNDYYLIHSTFAYFPGLPIFHSNDLVNWTQLGHIFDRPEQFDFDGLPVSNGMFAPAITHHDGLFYAVCTVVGGRGNFVVTAEDPAGPWSDPVYTPFEGIDPSLFFDDDGRAWMVNNGAPEGTPLYDGHRAIWIQEFDYKEKKMIGPRTMLVNGGVDISTKPIWIEGPHLYKRGGWYYLSCAEGGTGPDHSQVIFRSKQPDGPYEPWEGNPILTQRFLDPSVAGAVTCTGHADYVTGPDGEWYAVFLGVRPYDRGFSPMGRETFILPMKWPEGGWPMILPSTERVPLVIDAPAGKSFVQNPDAPMSGNFSWRDDFNGSELSKLWIMLRTPTEQWWQLDAAQGTLELRPRKEKLYERNNPSFLARRVQHRIFDAALRVQVPDSAGVSAGMAVFQNDTHHYFAAVRRNDAGKMELYLERALKDSVETLASVELPAGESVDFRVVTRVDSCAFEYAVNPGQWMSLAERLDAKMLTTAVAGGFVGATVGPHTRID